MAIFYFSTPANVTEPEKGFALESGVHLPDFHLGYTAYGKLNDTGDNVVWIFHALTANSEPAEWWSGLVGAGKLFDPVESFIICVNTPGSCYGSISPLDINPGTGEPWYHHFPFFTTRDMIRAYQQLKNALGITQIKIGIGGSMGGQQLLEWAIEEPGLFQHIVPIATNAVHSAWGRAFNATQRHAIEADRSWQEKRPDAGKAGLAVAREIALISYRHYNAYAVSQEEKEENALENFRSESYQRHQGHKLVNRFNAFSYYVLSKSMDAHDLGRGRGGVEKALAQITARALVIGISSDILFPLEEQRFLAGYIPGALFAAISSEYGHDGFLLEYEQLTALITPFLQENKKGDIGKVQQSQNRYYVV